MDDINPDPVDTDSLAALSEAVIAFSLKRHWSHMHEPAGSVGEGHCGGVG